MSINTGNHGFSMRPGSSSGGGALNGAASTFSPNAANPRETLRGDSIQDSPGSRTQHGAIGAPLSSRSNTVGAYGNGGISSFQRERSQSTPTMSGVSSAGVNSAIRALLETGAVTVSISTERELPNSNPHRPAFLKGVVFDANNPAEWFQVVLPYVRELTFIVASSSDIHYAGPMLASPFLPQLHTAIKKLQLPFFYWFSGVAHNRRHNPYLQMTSHLPALQELSLTMHTAGVTTSCYSERQMIALEAVDPVRSKARKVMRLEDVVAKYELDALFACRSLRCIRLEYIDCEMTAHFCTVGSPVHVLQGVQARLVQGFANMGVTVRVELLRVS